MNSLNRIDTSRARAILKPGTKEWCELVEEKALERAIKTAEAGPLSPADVTQLMKIRKSLYEQLGRRRKVTWVDPERWKSEPSKPA